MAITQLKVGDQVKLGHAQSAWWWSVRASDERFTVLTHQAPFEPKGTNCYTIIDQVRGVRGPCNLIGQGWDVDEDGGCDDLLRALNYHLEVSRRLEAGEESVGSDEPSTEVSYRNNVPAVILDIRTPVSK